MLADLAKHPLLITMNIQESLPKVHAGGIILSVLLISPGGSSVPLSGMMWPTFSLVAGQQSPTGEMAHLESLRIGQLDSSDHFFWGKYSVTLKTLVRIILDIYLNLINSLFMSSWFHSSQRTKSELWMSYFWWVCYTGVWIWPHTDILGLFVFYFETCSH